MRKPAVRDGAEQYVGCSAPSRTAGFRTKQQKGATVSESEFPAGWDADRVRKLIDHYEAMSDDELAAEDDAAGEEQSGQTVITVPNALLPAIRQMLARHNSA